MFDLTKQVVKKSKKEVVFKVITSFFCQGLLLIMPIYWSDVINHLTEANYHKAYYLIIVLILLSILYYIWAYFNQKAWYLLYNKLYLGYTDIVLKDNNNINKVKLGEYTNILNTDIDIICTFLGNIIIRIIQILEFFVIYAYFLSLNIYIFLITLIISIFMVVILLLTGKNVQKANMIRKSALDDKTITTHNLYDNLIKKSNNKVKILNKFNKENITYLKENYKYNILALTIIYIILGCIELARYGLIFYGIYLISIGNMEIGTIVLIYTYYSKILTNFENLGTISADYRSFIVSLKRLNYIRDN